MRDDPQAIPDHDAVRLKHMYDACTRAIAITRGIALETCPSDDQTALAVTRLLEIIGEAAQRVGSRTRERCPDIPWRLMAGMRNRLIHAYYDVDMEVVASVVREDLPQLQSHLALLLTPPPSEPGQGKPQRPPA